MNEAYSLSCLNDLDPALVEEAAAPRRRRPKVWKAAVIAACLCAAVVGTAFAAARIAGFDSVEPTNNIIDQGTSYDGYTLKGGRIRYIPLDDLSAAVRDIAEQNPARTVKLPVSDAEQLESLLGLELPEIPTAEGLEYDSFAAQMSSDQVGPTVIEYTAVFSGPTSSSLKYEVHASIYTESMYDPETALFTTYAFPSEYLFTTEEYTTAAGVSILLTHAQCPPKHILYYFRGSDFYYADHISDGIRYHMEVFCPDDPSQTLPVLQAVLESFDP